MKEIIESQYNHGGQVCIRLNSMVHKSVVFRGVAIIKSGSRVDRNVHIGKNVVIKKGSHICNKTHIGNNVIIKTRCVTEEGTTINKGSTALKETRIAKEEFPTPDGQ